MLFALCNWRQTGFCNVFPGIRAIQRENRCKLALPVEEGWHHRLEKTGDEVLDFGNAGFRNTSQLPCYRQVQFEPVS